MEYRKATLQDINALVELRIEMRNERESPEGVDLVLFRENTRAYYHNRMADGSYVSWVAAKNGRIVAMSGMYFYEVPPTYSNINGMVAYVMSVYTKPEYRRQGIAQALFEHLLAQAKSKGCTEISLNASSMGRPMYEKYGFAIDNQAMKLHLSVQND